MKRCDVIIAALPGDKPRPAVIVQVDALRQSSTVLVCPFTNGLEFDAEHRLVMEPDSENGLRSPSVLMIERLQAVSRSRCGAVVGRIGPAGMDEIAAKLAFVLGLGSGSRA